MARKKLRAAAIRSTKIGNSVSKNGLRVTVPSNSKEVRVLKMHLKSLNKGSRPEVMYN